MRRVGGVVGAVVLVAFIVSVAVAAPRGPGEWRGGCGPGEPPGGPAGLEWPALLARLVLPLGFVWLGYVAIARLARSREDQALVILKERYARGEITAEEYQATRRTLA